MNYSTHIIVIHLDYNKHEAFSTADLEYSILKRKRCNVIIFGTDSWAEALINFMRLSKAGIISTKWGL